MSFAEVEEGRRWQVGVTAGAQEAADHAVRRANSDMDVFWCVFLGCPRQHMTAAPSALAQSRQRACWQRSEESKGRTGLREGMCRVRHIRFLDGG